MNKVAVAATLGAALLLSACNESNPLIGKWSGDKANTFPCPDRFEFTEDAVTGTMGSIVQTHAVTYKRDGDHYLVIDPSGTVTTTSVSGNLLTISSPFRCRYGRVT
jgi:hypothetical protein